MRGHVHTVGAISTQVEISPSACRTLPNLAGIDTLTGGDPADRPVTGQYRSHLGTILADADLAIARRDWLDELLDDVMAVRP